MKVLIVGGGGREHALAWKAAQSPKVDHVLVAPGNAGTATEPKVENVNVGAEDIPGLVTLARDYRVDLTIVGPETPLVMGIVDMFQESGLKCFGPTKLAARLEASKSFTKDFLARHNIPSAKYKTFTEFTQAQDYIRTQGTPIVVKADGLAAGKGVTVAYSEDQALAAAYESLAEKKFGEAGSRIVIEEYVTGEEASFICMVDGEHILPLASSQDHKARDDGDIGPNTGGMGAYSPAPVITEAMHTRIMQEVIVPTVEGLASDGTPYTGFLYAGLMIKADGTPQVLEYNCRFGDPETQPILYRLQSDLVDLCTAAFEQRLDEVTPEWDPRACLGVVMAAHGYPGSYDKGYVISGLDDVNGGNVKVFHAGTASQNGTVYTNGGRVLCVTALGADVRDAQAVAYAAVKRIHWSNVYYRTDIGYRATNGSC